MAATIIISESTIENIFILHSKYKTIIYLILHRSLFILYYNAACNKVLAK